MDFDGSLLILLLVAELEQTLASGFLQSTDRQDANLNLSWSCLPIDRRALPMSTMWDNVRHVPYTLAVVRSLKEILVVCAGGRGWVEASRALGAI